MEPLTIIALSAAAVSVGTIIKKVLQSAIQAKSYKSEKSGVLTITIEHKNGEKVIIRQSYPNTKELIETVDSVLH